MKAEPGTVDRKASSAVAEDVEARAGRPPKRPPILGQWAWGRLFERIRGVSGVTSGIGLLVVWVLLSFATPNFLTTSNILNILLQASNLAILAGGVTLVLISAEIDLSIASVEALSGSIIAVLVVQQGVPWPLALVIGLTSGVIAGTTNGFFTTRFGMPSFVTTLAMLGIARGLAFVITDGTSVYGLPRALTWVGQGEVGSIPVAVIVAAVVLLALHVLLTRTKFGLNLYAVGGNAEAARLAGVNVARTKLLALMLSGLMAAVAGTILAARLGAGSGNVGEADLLDAIAAVVIGGTSLFGGVGRIGGTVIGVLLIASIRNGLVLLGVGAFWQPVAIGTLILVAVFLDHVAKRR